jgi:hypothetical protein
MTKISELEKQLGANRPMSFQSPSSSTANSNAATNMPLPPRQETGLDAEEAVLALEDSTMGQQQYARLGVNTDSLLVGTLPSRGIVGPDGPFFTSRSDVSTHSLRTRQCLHLTLTNSHPIIHTRALLLHQFELALLLAGHARSWRPSPMRHMGTTYASFFPLCHRNQWPLA